MGDLVNYATSASEQLILDIQSADDEVSGYPRTGKHVGPSTFRGKPVRWCALDPEDSNSPGWTVHRCGIRKHPTLPFWAYHAREGLAEFLAGKLPPQAIAAIEAAAPLSPDWFPPMA